MSLNETGKTYERPWGWYKTLEMQDHYQVKLIHVIPGGRLSLQSHVHRAEHWIIARGTATVTLNDSVNEYMPNQVIFIPKEAKHRLENLGKTAVEIIEVQMGDYLGEDDIKRYDDIYGRI
jgi:mannose-6-phosphate isomerase-like protein (cupin superfamily)